METGTTFDLNAHLARWRDGLKNRPAILDEDIEELESHLRDAMDALRQTKLSEEEAFLVAARRVGHPAALGEEYCCARPGSAWRERARWMILGILSWWVVSGLANLGSTLTLLLGGRWAGNGIALGYIGLAVQTLLLGGLGWLALHQFTRVEKGGASGSASRGSSGRMRLLISLSVAAVVINISSRLAHVLAVRVNGAAVFGGFYLVTAWGQGVLTMGLVIAAGIWLAWAMRYRRDTINAVVALLVFAGMITGCKPGGTTAGSGQPPAVNQDAVSGFESCLALINSDTNAAVEAFLKLDLAKAALFSPGRALSYSEAEFIKLPSAAREKMGSQANADLGLLKQLVRAVKARGEQARSAGDSALAGKCKAQLVLLAERLEGPDNLKIAQLIGKAVRKMSVE